MSFFGVTIEEIETVSPHPNADRLELATMKGLGFYFVVGKGLYRPGTTVLYFPVDSLLPDPVAEKLGVKGKLAGSNKNRVKTIKLRGEISQGLTGPLDLLPPDMIERNSSEEITSYLGVTKYEPPVVYTASGKLLPLPDGYPVYDIEGCDRNKDIVDLLMDVPVCVSEKLEGMNCSIIRKPDGQILVNSRNYTIIEEDGKLNIYWDTLRKNGILAKLQNLNNWHDEIAIYGEIVGPGSQGNYYGLDKTLFFVFDVKVNGKWLGVNEQKEFLSDPHTRCLSRADSGGKDLMDPILVVPGEISTLKLLLSDPTSPTIQKLSDGYSRLNPNVLREGIVIRPVNEMNHPRLGRVILKQRSPQYLAKTEN